MDNTNLNVVYMTKDEYKEYCILKYEQEKRNAMEQVVKTRADEINEKILVADKVALIGLLFRRAHMGRDTRSEQTNLVRDNCYKGFSNEALDYLYSLGITKQELLDYINKQWDLKEAQEQQEVEQQ